MMGLREFIAGLDGAQERPPSPPGSSGSTQSSDPTPDDAGQVQRRPRHHAASVRTPFERMLPKVIGAIGC